MPTQSYSISFSSVLSPLAGEIFKGDALTLMTLGYVLANTANLAASLTGRVDCFALEDGRAGNAIRTQSDGRMDPEVTDLAADSSTGYADVNALGRLVATTVTSSATVGVRGKDGSVALGIGSTSVASSEIVTVPISPTPGVDEQSLEVIGGSYTPSYLGPRHFDLRSYSSYKVGNDWTQAFRALYADMDSWKAGTRRTLLADIPGAAHIISGTIRKRGFFGARTEGNGEGATYLTYSTTAPSAIPTAASAGGGAVAASTYQYMFTWVSGAGTTLDPVQESEPSPMSAPITVGGSNIITVSNVSVGPAGTTARKVYVTAPDDPSRMLYLGTIADNTGTTIQHSTVISGVLESAYHHGRPAFYVEGCFKSRISGMTIGATTPVQSLLQIAALDATSPGPGARGVGADFTVISSQNTVENCYFGGLLDATQFGTVSIGVRVGSDETAGDRNNDFNAFKDCTFGAIGGVGLTVEQSQAFGTVGHNNRFVGQLVYGVGAPLVSITSGLTTVTHTGLDIRFAQVGHYIEIAGAGAAGGTLRGYIVRPLSATTFQLSVAAGTTVVGAQMTIGSQIGTCTGPGLQGRIQLLSGGDWISQAGAYAGHLRADHYEGSAGAGCTSIKNANFESSRCVLETSGPNPNAFRKFEFVNNRCSGDGAIEGVPFMKWYLSSNPNFANCSFGEGANPVYLEFSGPYPGAGTDGDVGYMGGFRNCSFGTTKDETTLFSSRVPYLEDCVLSNYTAGTIHRIGQFATAIACPATTNIAFGATRSVHIAITGNTTVTFEDGAFGRGFGSEYRVTVKATGGPWTITWPAGVTFVKTPVAIPSGGVDVFRFTRDHASSLIIGIQEGA